MECALSSVHAFSSWFTLWRDQQSAFCAQLLPISDHVFIFLSIVICVFFLLAWLRCSLSHLLINNWKVLLGWQCCSYLLPLMLERRWCVAQQLEFSENQWKIVFIWARNLFLNNKAAFQLRPSPHVLLFVSVFFWISLLRPQHVYCGDEVCEGLRRTDRHVQVVQ